MELLEKIDGSRAVEFIGDFSDQTETLVNYDFAIGPLKYEVEFSNNGEWTELVFTMTDKDNPLGTVRHISVGMDVAIKVFHTVWMIIKDYLGKVPAKFIKFSAKSDDPSRIKFYRTLSKQLAFETGNSPEDVKEGKSSGVIDFVVPVSSKKSLTEKIDGSQALDWDKISPDKYYFFLPKYDLDYDVMFDQDGDTVDVIFKAGGPDTNYEMKHDQMELGFSSAISVFHTVYMIIKDFLESSLDPIDILEFSAKKAEPSRVKFYRTLARQLAKEYGYEASDVEETGRYDVTSITFIVPVAK